MNLNINVFGFNVQITRPKIYGVTFLIGEWDHSAFIWELKSSSRRYAGFLGWKLALKYAKNYGHDVTYVVWKINSDGLHEPVGNGTIKVTKSVSIFPK